MKKKLFLLFNSDFLSTNPNLVYDISPYFTLPKKVYEKQKVNVLHNLDGTTSKTGHTHFCSL